MVKVRLYRPFDSSAFLKSLPATVKSIAVLDRCKEPGATGEPLYMDIVTVLAENEAALPFASRRLWADATGFLQGVHPRDGQGHLRRTVEAAPKNHFTIGIGRRRLALQPELRSQLSTEDPQTVRALFYGLGSDGTVARTRTRSRSSATRHRTTRRATLSTTRRSPAQ